MLSGSFSDEDLLPPSNNSQKKSIKSNNTSASNEVVKGYQVTAFKYVESKYENLGKVGLVLLVSKATNSFSLLLYTKGNAALAQATINKDFGITGGRDLYISFYDIKSINWSILFETSDFYNDFLNRVAIMKLITSKQDMISFDVKVGEGTSANESDLCEIDVTIMTVKNLEIISTLFSSDVQESNKISRFKIGSNKFLPAIDKGITGMMKGGHRIISVSSNSTLLKGGSVSVSADMGIVAHLKIVRIKTKTEKPTVNNEMGDSELSLPNLNFGQSSKETESDNADQSRKLELLNRMKVLGQPLLGFTTEDRGQINQKNPDVQIPHQYSVPTHSYTPSTEFQHIQPPINNQIIYNPASSLPSYGNQLMPLQGSASMITNMHPSFQTIPNMLTMTDNNAVTTENRQHNSEMRIAISKLQDKIDRIGEKLDSNVLNQKPSASRHMDAENVFENIKRIIDENEAMKLECSHKSDTIDSQNRRINELLMKNQKYLEDSRNVNDRTSVTFSSMDSENQAKILKLEEEKLELIRNLSKKTSELSQFEIKVESLNSESQNYRNKALEYNDQLTKMSTELGEFKLKNRNLALEVDKLRDDRSNSLVLNEELMSYKSLAAENERKLQHSIELLKNNIKEANSRTEQVKAECEVEILEIRKNCSKEIEEWRNKLKEERRMISSKSSNFESEIDSVNREWEIKLEEVRKSETNRLLQMKQRNDELIKEISYLNSEILRLKDQLSVTDSSASVKLEELSINNRSLQRKLDDAQNRLHEMENLSIQNGSLEMELTKLRKHSVEAVELKSELDLITIKNRELESTVKKLTNQLKVGLLENPESKADDEDVERQVKAIMNDVFKKIKLQFELGKNYDGKDITNKCMIIIRDATMSQMKATNEDESSEEEITESDISGDERHDEDSQIKESSNVISNVQPVIMTAATENSSDFSEDDHRTLHTTADDISDPLNDLKEQQQLSENLHGIVVDETLDDVQINKVQEATDVNTNEYHDTNFDIVSENTEEHFPVSQSNENETFLEDKNAVVVPHNEEDHLQYVENRYEKHSPDLFEEKITPSVENTEDQCVPNNRVQEEQHLPNDHNIEVLHVDKNSEVSFRPNNDSEDNILLESNDQSIEGAVQSVVKSEDSSLDNDGNTTSKTATVDSDINVTTEYVSSDFGLIVEHPPAIEPDHPTEQSASGGVVKEKESLFSSDDDDDVMGFFEQISEKKKKQVKVEQTKPFISDDDDGLSWLHS